MPLPNSLFDGPDRRDRAPPHRFDRLADGFSRRTGATIAPDLFLAQPISSARLPLDILLAGVEKGLPDHENSSWAFASEPGAVDRVYVVKHQHYERLLVTVNLQKASKQSAGLLICVELASFSGCDWLFTNRLPG